MSAGTGSAVAVSAGCEDRGMPMCDYFSASDDRSAVGVLDHPGGPGASGCDVVSLKGMDPSVTMASLEAILTGCTYDEARRVLAPVRSSRLPNMRAHSSSACPTPCRRPWHPPRMTACPKPPMNGLARMSFRHAGSPPTRLLRCCSCCPGWQPEPALGSDACTAGGPCNGMRGEE